jgi:hypothetical protein
MKRLRPKMKALAVIFFASVGLAHGATCDRDCLFAVATEYFDALAAHRPEALRLAPNARFTEDTAEMKVADSPLWKHTSGLRPYRMYILDVRQGVAVALAIAEESGMPVMLVARLKVVDGKISEIETQVTRNKTEGAIFDVEALKEPSKAMLLEPDAAQRNSRDEAVQIAEHYPHGLQAGSFVTVDAPFADDTYRFENGRLMAGPGCTFMPGCEHIKSQKVPKLAGLTYRVAAVDEDLGIVLLRMDFGPGSTRTAGDSLMVWEAFKVYGGQIHAVEAFMKNMPQGTPSGWDSPRGR